MRARKSAAAADAQASIADYHGARLSLAAATSKAWFAVLEAKLQLELAETTVESFTDTERQVRERFERGVRTSLDLRLARSNRAAAEAARDVVERRLDLSRRQLEVLLGRYPAAALEVADDLPTVGEAVPAGLPAELVARRPDLVSAERRLAAADQRVKEARRSLYPRISLTASGGTSSSELEDLVDTDFSVWSLAGNLFAPLFQGGRLRAQVDANEATTVEALEFFSSTALTAYSEVEHALAAEAFLERQEEHLTQAANDAVNAQRVAEEQYRAGLVDFITVLQSQRNALNLQSELLIARRARLANRVDLHVALGGGFEVVGPKAESLVSPKDIEE